MTIIKSKLTEYLLAASFFTILLIFHSSNALAAGAVLTPKGYIDAPATGATLKGISVVKGWFLDGSGVSKVEVLVDGKTIGQAQYGSSRTDVEIAYPAYQNANAGYQYSLNTANLLNGQHTLTVRETGKNGAMTELKRLVTVQNAVQNTVQNLPAKGTIDEPNNGATVKDSTLVRGWFLDGSGVSKVEVLVDGKSVGQAQYGLSRTDVSKAYPAYKNANAGYQYTLNTKNLSNGQHTLTVRETGKNGARTELKRLVNVQNTIQNTVQNLAVRGVIDEPKNGSTVNGSTLVRGWFLDGSGVSKVEVLVDGKSVGQAQYGLSRTDVSKAYPAYKNANAGYQYTLNTKNLSNGQHTLTVSETGKNGAKKELKSLFTVQNTVQTLPVRGTIDAPVNGATVKGTTLVRGWFLDGSGVAKVEVLVDGKLLAQAQYGLSRTDVARVYPAYKNTNAGYQYTIDTTNLSNGQHTLTVRETGKSGAKLELKRLITVQNTVVNLVTRGVIDEPKNGATVSGSTLVRGWFLDGSGVSKVEVLVDGKSVGQAQYGLSRTDVSNAYPAYKNDNSGYQYTLNTVNLTNGQHTLTVRETGKNGAIKELRSLFSVLNLPVRGSLESPKNGVTIEGNTLVSGWFLDQSGVSKVEVLVDGIVIGEAKYGVSRSDINQAYPDYQNVNAGFQYTLNPENLTPGQHTLTVRETGKNGLKTELQSQFNIQGLPSKGSLDSPNSGTVLKGKAIVSGWFLDGSGVNRIEVLVDGSLMGEADYGLARTDVQSVYPEYKNANSGFQYTLNTLQLKDGEHTLSVKETGINGETSTITTQITVGNGNLYTILNLKKPSTITASEIVAFFDKKNPTSPLKSYAQSFINAQNMYGVNALYLLAHTIWETGWGGSDLITYKHNLYGYGAYDVCPFTCGYYFPTVEDSINKVAYQVRHDYLDESGAYYNSSYGPTLTGMNVRYATDQNWKNGIANLMESMKPYDSSYYWNLPELNVTASAPPTYGRDIPDGQLYPTDTIINFPSGIVAKVTTSSVNLRSLPYLSTSTIIGSLNFNTVVSMVGYNTDVYYDPTSTNYDGYRWYRVAANGQNGWLNGQNVTIGNLLQVDSDADNLCVRSSASTSSTILTYVDSETYLKAVTNTNGDVVSQNGWYNVYLPNSTSTGWVSGEFVSQITH